MRSALPLVFEFVLVLALVLMLYAFRSIVIAVKAIVLNLLSVAAAYGVLVLAFQHGWGSGLAARPRVLERRGDPPRHHLHARRRDRRATMARLGERDWYLPRWLRWLPRPPAERLAEPAASARGLS